jgi:hypothetical protein
MPCGGTAAAVHVAPLWNRCGAACPCGTAVCGACGTLRRDLVPGGVLLYRVVLLQRCVSHLVVPCGTVVALLVALWQCLARALWRCFGYLVAPLWCCSRCAEVACCRFGGGCGTLWLRCGGDCGAVVVPLWLCLWHLEELCSTVVVVALNAIPCGVTLWHIVLLLWPLRHVTCGSTAALLVAPLW